jgi:hypothetical protein
MAKRKLGFVIYRVSWEVYDNDGCYEVFYTDWSLDKKITISHLMELLELSKVRKDIHVNDIQEEFVSCTKEEIQELINSWEDN